MKQLRRLDVPKPQGPYRKAQLGLLRHVDLSEVNFQALEQERPDLIIEEGDAVLIGQPFRRAVSLHYAFPDRDAFARQFPDMFERLLAVPLDQDETPLGFRLTLTDRPSRPYLEPVLFAHAFELSREWMEMTLVELPEGGALSDDIAPGFRLRPARPDDADALVQLEEQAFPTLLLPADHVLAVLGTATAVYRILEESASARPVGFLRLRAGAPGAGHISDFAVHPDSQRRGLGEAMLRWALAWFRSEGLRRAILTVSVDNAPAIALYRKLGFTSGEVGVDYRRPIDEEEARHVLEKHRAAHSRVRHRT